MWGVVDMFFFSRIGGLHFLLGVDIHINWSNKNMWGEIFSINYSIFFPEAKKIRTFFLTVDFFCLKIHETMKLVSTWGVASCLLKKTSHTQFQPWGRRFRRLFSTKNPSRFVCRFPVFYVNFLLGWGEGDSDPKQKPPKPKVTGQLTNPASHEYLPRHEALGRGGLWKP